MKKMYAVLYKQSFPFEDDYEELRCLLADNPIDAIKVLKMCRELDDEDSVTLGVTWFWSDGSFQPGEVERGSLLDQCIMDSVMYSGRR